MPKLPRSATLPPEGFFHAFSRAVDGARIYRDDVDRRRFVDLLQHCFTTHAWTCHAYCLLSTHYHVVVEAQRTDLSAGMHHLNSRHAQEFNRRHGRYGALFAERFTARVVESEDYLYDACAYVLLNPVKAGLCDRSDEWPWSFSSFGLQAS